MSKGAETKRQILDTAVKLASVQGISGLTIGELAKEVGMSKSGLFAHFGAKDELQLSVLEMAVEKFIETVMIPAFQEERGIPRIRTLFENWMLFIEGNNELPGGSILISASIELDDQPGPLRDYVKNAQLDLVKNIEKAVEIAVEEQHFRQDIETREFAWTLYSFVLGYHHFNKMLEAPDAAELVRKSFDELIRFASIRKN